MPSVLDNMLEKLVGVLDEVDSRINRGFNSFSMPSTIIQDWDEYESCLARFYCYLECAILNIRHGRDVDLEQDFWRCCDLLKKEFGRSAEKAAFELTRTGSEGGLLRVLKSIVRLMRTEYADSQIGTLVSDYWESRSPDELLADSNEYLKKYSHLLPSELTEGSAGRIRGDFPKVLKQHPYMMRRMRQIGR